MRTGAQTIAGRWPPERIYSQPHQPRRILSIQSWVATGHVGNAAAVFALQRLGVEVSAIHTVQFSNHPGHGAFTGRAYPAAETRALIDGLAAHGTLARLDAVLSGYLLDAGTGEAVLHAASLAPHALYACDPVIGDNGRAYVQPEVATFFRDRAVPRADIITPNQFELATLTGMPCATRHEAEAAIAALRARLHGPAIVLLTSFDSGPTLDVCVAGAEGTHWIAVPKLPRTFSGAGDLLASLFLYHVLAGASPVPAAGAALVAVQAVLARTHQRNARELLIVEAQDDLVRAVKAPPP